MPKWKWINSTFHKDELIKQFLESAKQRDATIGAARTKVAHLNIFSVSRNITICTNFCNCIGKLLLPILRL